MLMVVECSLGLAGVVGKEKQPSVMAVTLVAPPMEKKEKQGECALGPTLAESRRRKSNGAL